jgi:hypothetical protein
MVAATGRASASEVASRRARIATIVLSSIATVALVPLALEAVSEVVRGEIGAVPFGLLFLFLPLNLGIVGAVLTTRRPGNVIGWMLLVCGTIAAVTFAAGEYERSAIGGAGADAPLAVLAAWVASFLFIPAIGILVVFLPLLYPSGRLLSPRWRWVAVVGILGVATGTIGAAVAPGPLGDPQGPANPFVPPEPILAWIGAATTLSNVVAPPVFVLALTSLLLRFRRSRGVERQQIKVFLFVASVGTVLFAISVLSIGPASDAAWALGLVTMAMLPLAIGLAILRYRLYDIDRVVSRAVGYTLVTVIVTQAVLTPVTQSSSAAVAASTLLVAGLFQPVRGAIQRRVDRRFDRSRVNAERLVSGFGETLRDVTDLSTIQDALVATAAATWTPSAIAVWRRTTPHDGRDA